MEDNNTTPYNISEHGQPMVVSGWQVLQLTIPNVESIDAGFGLNGFEVNMSNGDAELLTIDPNVYYVVGESGVVTIQTLNEGTELNGLLAQNTFCLTDPMMIQEQPNSADGMSVMLPPELILPKPVTRKRKTQKRRREQSEELTSDAYRSRLLKSSAEKEVKVIKKAQRRTKRKKDDTNGSSDVLCSSCGECFSKSVDGKGWMLCIKCRVWYHSECGTFDQMICEACA